MTTETDVIAEVQRRLDTFHSPSFDREIVEQLLALARRSAASAEPAVAVTELVATAAEWKAKAQMWAGTAWLAGEELPADAMSEGDHKRDLYSDLCRLINVMQYFEDEIAALAPSPSPVVSEAMVQRGINALNDAMASHPPTIVTKDGVAIIHPQTAAAAMRAALTAALSPAPAGEVGWRTGDTMWRYKLHMSDAWTYTDRPLSPKELGPNGRQEQGHFPTGGDK